MMFNLLMQVPKTLGKITYIWMLATTRIPKSIHNLIIIFLNTNVN